MATPWKRFKFGGKKKPPLPAVGFGVQSVVCVQTSRPPVQREKKK
jgi:hypothetical protein